MLRVLLLALLSLCLGTTMGASAEPKAAELGIPVKSVNWVRLFAGANASGEDRVYVTMGQQAENLFVLEVDPKTGRFSQYLAPGEHSQYPTAAYLSRDGRLYIGAAYSGHLLCFDPKLERVEDLGAIDPSGGSFPCRIDEAPDGSLFIGCYGNAGLTRFDPKTGKFTRYGRLDAIDMYCYPLVAPDGIVAAEIRMTRPHVVLVNPKTGEKKAVGPVVTAGKPGDSLSLLRGDDGNLYIASSQGNFRIEGMEAKPVAKVPEAAPARTLSDGSTFSFADAEEQFHRLLVIRPRSGPAREFRLNYNAAGSDIFLLHLGPDGKIYGSSVLPLHLFRYDPQSKEVADLGPCSRAAGEAYSMGNLDGKLYICSYPNAVLSVYDPRRPYHFGTKPGDNPRDLGTMDGGVSLRPRAMLVGPLGRVWTGSYPAYGTWGGPLAWYDPKTGEKRSYRNVLPDQSVCALAWDASQQLIVGGTSIEGGTGTQPKATEAALFLWDPMKEEKVWSGPPRPGVRAVTALVAARDGLIYGIDSGAADGKSFRDLFVFDPRARRVVRTLALPEGGVPDCSLQLGSDGDVYGITTDTVYRIKPGANKVEVLARLPGQIEIPGPLVGNTLYFATGHRLRSVKLGGKP